MIDWLTDFVNKFGNYKEIQEIKQNKLHGSLTINFCGGEALNYNLNIHRRIEVNLNPKEKNGEATQV